MADTPPSSSSHPDPSVLSRPHRTPHSVQEPFRAQKVLVHHHATMKRLLPGDTFGGTKTKQDHLASLSPLCCSFLNTHLHSKSAADLLQTHLQQPNTAHFIATAFKRIHSQPPDTLVGHCVHQGTPSDHGRSCLGQRATYESDHHADIFAA